jgi:hypothetical protein
MKASISIPDPLFKDADRVANRLGLSRSQLYAQAVAEFIRTYEHDESVEYPGRIPGEEPSDCEPRIVELRGRSPESTDGDFWSGILEMRSQPDFESVDFTAEEIEGWRDRSADRGFEWDG